jgi:teichuronic acid exporter
VSDIKNKTISGVFWSAVENFANLGLQFVIGIIIARMVSPEEYGLVGMITIFIAISQTFIDSGFVSALVRKPDVTKTDYSTAFFYNLSVGIFFYLALFFFANSIAGFFDEPELVAILRVLGLGLIIGSLTIVQNAVLLRRVDFKLNAKIKVSSAVMSGSIAIYLAYRGFGVWSLVVRQLLESFFSSLFLWIWNRFIPSLVFSIKSFRELFGYGSKLLISGLIGTIFNNIYLVVIGKFFSAADLGYYTRASSLKDLPSQNITNIITRVTFPVLAQMQDNPVALKAGYKRMIKTTMFLSFSLLIGMAAVASPLILTLIGEPWRPSIIYLQLLCFVGMLFPLHALNLNLLNVLGRSDLFLKLEIIKKILVIPAIIIGIIWGIKVMILGMWVNSLVGYYLNSYYSGRFINYPMREQVNDILPSLLIAILMGALVYVSGLLIPFGNLIKLILQITLGGLLVVSLSELFKLESYLYTKILVKDKLIALYNARK